MIGTYSLSNIDIFFLKFQVGFFPKVYVKEIADTLNVGFH